jgi:hypothetical protein
MVLMLHRFIGTLVLMEARSLGLNIARKNEERVSWEQLVKSAGDMENLMA